MSPNPSPRKICEGFRLWLRQNGSFHLCRNKQRRITADVPFTLEYTADRTKAFLKVRYTQLPRGFRPQELPKTVERLAELLGCPVSLHLSTAMFVVRVELEAVLPDQVILNEVEYA